MNRTDSPAKQPKPFGINGPREPILANTPAGDNTASYDSGFPPITMTLKSAGGLPPKGQDMNQILYELSALCRWFSAGAYNAFDSAFSTSIGGYPKGSAVISDDNTKIYLSTIDANTNNPNSVSTGWLDLLEFLGGAPLASPSFTGIPLTPTAAPGTNTTQIASTAFVRAAITALSLGTASTKNVGTGSGQIPDMSSFVSSKTSTTIVLNLPGGYKLMCGQQLAPTDAQGNVFLTLPDTFPTGFIYAEAHQSKTSYAGDIDPYIFSSYPSTTAPVSQASFAVRNTKSGIALANSSIVCMYFVWGY
ncbi:hypothetical protein [Enterobacter asburiae]|uniref:hypothetical protein n=1 Tax=Enterobacter asburiae TaxID=61645 RepID=UPI0021D26479|nr:hypothetical protein [Enterobacter asburiae]MCU6243300.1 hypothetical protein [Enterobacter asburiae]